MKTSDTISSLELSLIPAVLASSCCLTIPALTLLGFSFSENIFYEYRGLLRLGAILLILVSLVFFFRKEGIKTKLDFIKEKRMVIAITIQTVLFAVLIYLIFLKLVVPLLCSISGIGQCSI